MISNSFIMLMTSEQFIKANTQECGKYFDVSFQNDLGSYPNLIFLLVSFLPPLAPRPAAPRDAKGYFRDELRRLRNRARCADSTRKEDNI